MGLTITRRKGERILIGPNIVVLVVSVEGNKVRLDVTAPRDLLILREELIDTPPERNPDASR